MQTHYLRWKDSDIAWVAFTSREDDKVDVLGKTGAVYYIDRPMARDEAKSTWREYIARGWHHALAEEVAEQQMDLRRLKLICYD